MMLGYAAQRYTATRCSAVVASWLAAPYVLWWRPPRRGGVFVFVVVVVVVISSDQSRKMLLENTAVARSSVSASMRRQQWSRRYRRYDVMFDELDSSTTGGTRSHRQLGKRELRWIIQATMLFCILAVGLVCSYLSITSPRDVERDGEHHTRLRTRSLTSTGKPECHVVAFERYGGVTIEVLAVLYLFIGIAIVADDYFIVALEVISEKLDIAPDVAGMYQDIHRILSIRSTSIAKSTRVISRHILSSRIYR